MRSCYRVLVFACAVTNPANGQSLPVYSVHTIAPEGRREPAPIAPGMVMSVFGEHLGPQTPCTGSADPQRREHPHPSRPNQTLLETQVFPTKLCNTEVKVGGMPAGLLYVQAGQINFKVPQTIPIQGTTQVQVVYQDRSGPQVILGLTNKPNSLPAQQLAESIWSALQAVKWNATYLHSPDICLPVSPPQFLSESSLASYARYCSEPAKGISRNQFYYPVGVVSPSILLRRADFRLVDEYPALSEEVEQILRQKLTRLYGPGTVPNHLFEIGARPGLSWRTGNTTLFLHRNHTYVAPVGVRQGVVLIAVRQELLDERAQNEKLQEAFRSSTLLSPPVITADLRKELGPRYLIPAKLPTTEAERTQSEHETLASLLAILAQPKSAVLLVSADDLAVRLGRLLVAHAVKNGSETLIDAPDLARVRQQLLPHGIKYIGPGHYSGDYAYDRNLLRRAWQEFPDGPWGQRAFLMLQRLSCLEDVNARGPEAFRDVIAQGEAFLLRYPETAFRKEQLYHLAQAQETWWSLGQSTSNDDTAQGSHVDKPSAERARLKAIQLYEELFRQEPESPEALAGQLKLPRLKLKLDTGSRTFFCFLD